MYFRGGDEFHVFEYDQKMVKEWASCSEHSVLFHRCFMGIKPVATIVLDNYCDPLNIQLEAWNIGLTCATFENKWGVKVLNVTRLGDYTLEDLLHDREDCNEIKHF